MNQAARYLGGIALVLLLSASGSQCVPRGQTPDDTGPAPVDTTSTTGMDTLPAPDTSAATPPIIPPQPVVPQDTPPPGAQPSSGNTGGQKGTVSQAEYEGWRQYSVNCARCHGQDVLPNPVAANLLISLAPGGPMEAPEKFTQVVSEGRAERGMPAFKSIMSPDQIQAVYAYVKGRADKRIPPGRPAAPAG
jgi:mono/diheme cytochrome c family protein